MKLSTLFIGIISPIVINAPVALPTISFIGQQQAVASETCTYNGTGWDCKKDEEAKKEEEPTRSNGEKVPYGSLLLSSNGEYNPDYKVESFTYKVNIKLALTCGLTEKKVTDENGKEYCQSTDIGG